MKTSQNAHNRMKIENLTVKLQYNNTTLRKILLYFIEKQERTVYN